jgi:hypothetical protein
MALTDLPAARAGELAIPCTARVRRKEMQTLMKTNNKRRLIRAHRRVFLFGSAGLACWDAFCNHGWKNFSRVLPGRVCAVVCSANRQIKRLFAFPILFARHPQIASFIALSPLKKGYNNISF